MDRLDIDKKRAIELGVRYVDSYWKSVNENEVELSVLSGGYSSRLYLLEDTSDSTSNPIKKFLIRLYGGKMAPGDDPARPEGGEIKETLVFYAVGLAGLGPKLYGSFDGGRIEEFVYSHMLTEDDYNQRPETILELARKMARFHVLDLPISKERHHILNACELYLRNRDINNFRKLANHIGRTDIGIFEKFDVKSEIEWLKKMESVVSGRIVTISGDINKNNVLILDKPDKFGERVMMIDYELCSRDYRGRDIGQVFICKIFDMKDGIFNVSSDYPDDAWRRSFVIEYLRETKSLNNFEWDEKLDSVEHVLMEADFFMFHGVQMIIGFFLNQSDDSYFYKMPADQALSMLNVGAHIIKVYQERKAAFIETYGKQLDLIFGFIYVQLSGQSEPRNIWPTVMWTEVTSQYAGLFFRAVGGGSASFGSVQEENCPKLSSVSTHGITSLRSSIDIPTNGSKSEPVSTGVVKFDLVTQQYVFGEGVNNIKCVSV